MNCYSLNVDSIGRDCQRGQAKACTEITKIATTSKHPQERVAAIAFVSDISVLTFIMNEASQNKDVNEAASERLSELNRQKQALEELLKKQEQAREELQKSIAPNALEIQRQTALLASYKAGVTTLDDFFADKWNASDPLLSKLGIVAAHFDNINHSTEFHIAYYANYDKHAHAEVTVRAAEMVQGSFENVRSMAGVVTEGADYGPPPLFDSIAQIPLCVVDTKYPQYVVKFSSGRLVSIEKK
jgi:hypothetical protein